MDVIDKANQRASEDLARALQRRHQFQGASATHCIECDEPIPDQRRELLPGVQRCIDCQQLHEQRNKR